jgi:hypothetical protein
MAGGGIKGGSSYGETDEIGYDIVSGKTEAFDIQATILNQLGFDHEKFTYNQQGDHPLNRCEWKSDYGYFSLKHHPLMPEVNYETKQKKIYTNICNGSAALFLSSMESLSLSHQPAFTMNKNYELTIMATTGALKEAWMPFAPKQKKKVQWGRVMVAHQ